MDKMIITDLTRFSNGDIVCTAGTLMSSGQCVRPMPYLQTTYCVNLNILPGAILRGRFEPKEGLDGPHREDVAARDLEFEGPASSEQFRGALEAGLRDSVEAGFEIKLSPGQKYVPLGHPVQRSIITLSVSPKALDIVEDAYKPGKVKVHFVDGGGRQFRYLRKRSIIPILPR